MTPPRAVISVLVADDDADQRILLDRMLRSSADVRHLVTCVPDGRSALTALREEVFDVALLDLSMPGLDGLQVFEAIEGDPARPQVVFVSGKGTVSVATRAMKLGAYDWVEKPVDRERLLSLVGKAAEARAVRSRSERLEAVVSHQGGHGEILTRNSGMRRLLGDIQRVASSDVAVLVVGESGTGKELVAREVHRHSPRRDQPLVALNCAAVSETLAESELFGHEKGAFTGATTGKIGLVEMADGGTLFLDEVGEMTPGLQAKLLRTLESKRFRRVGGVKELPADFRLVSATNRRLESHIEEGSFREDLYYRINTVTLELPPLRERAGDVAMLASHFLGSAPSGDAWVFTEAARAVLESYGWPGNVRELRNVMERAALFSTGGTIDTADLGPSLASAPAGAGGQAGTAGQPDRLPSLDLAELEGRAVREALERTDWHQGQAAELLGISSRTLHRKIRGLGLRRPD